MVNWAFVSPGLKCPSARKNIESADIIPKCIDKVYILDDYVKECENSSYSLLLYKRFRCKDYKL